MKFQLRGMKLDDYDAILPLQREIQHLHRAGRPDAGEWCWTFSDSTKMPSPSTGIWDLRKK